MEEQWNEGVAEDTKETRRNSVLYFGNHESHTKSPGAEPWLLPSAVGM
jgi:hypothetical protein